MTTDQIRIAREQAAAFVESNIGTCATELLEWKETGTLSSGKVRELAQLCAAFTGGHNPLGLADSMISFAALRAVSAQHREVEPKLQPEKPMMLKLKCVQPEVSVHYTPGDPAGVRVTISPAQLHPVSKHRFRIDVVRYAVIASAIALELQPDKPVFQVMDLVQLLMDLPRLRSMVACIRPEDSPCHRHCVEWLHHYLSYWNDGDAERYRILMQGTASKLHNWPVELCEAS